MAALPLVGPVCGPQPLVQEGVQARSAALKGSRIEGFEGRYDPGVVSDEAKGLRMPGRNQVALSVALACAVLAVGAALYWTSRPSAEYQPAVPAVAPAPARHIAHATETVATVSSAAAVQPLPKMQSPPAPEPGDAAVGARRETFLRMAASQDPRDSYSAYAMLAQCRDAHQLEREWRDTRQNERTDSMVGLRGAMGGDYTKKACGDLTEADLAPASRLALIERAAQAGLPQAAIRLSAEGPFGDPAAWATRPDDPAVIEWEAKVASLIALAAEHGDVVSTMSLAEQYATGGGVLKAQDIRKALMFATAYRKLHELQTGRQLTRRQVQELEGMLPADAVQVAHAQGEAFAKSAFLKWQQARNQDQR